MDGRFRYVLLFALVVYALGCVAGDSFAQKTKCNNFTFDGTKSKAMGKGKLTYNWDFGDGTTGTAPIVTHKYEKAGEYKVTLTVTDESGTPCDTGMAAQTVKVFMPPKAVFTGPDIVCVGTEVMFDAGGSGSDSTNKLSYMWDFGDGSKAEGQKVSHKYEKGGSYRVMLTVDDKMGTECSTACVEKYISIHTTPVVKAGNDIVMCNLKPQDKYTVYFKGSGYSPDGCSLSYIWNFGDGTTSEGSSVSHEYAKAGKYRATLTVDDGCKSPCSTASDSINVTLMKSPVAAASVEDDKLCLGEEVRFDGSHSFVEEGQAGSYTWNFGDGTPEVKGVTVTHKYAKGGKYLAALILTDGRGCQGSEPFMSKSEVMVLINSAPVASLAKVNAACVGSKAEFDGSGSYDPDGDNLVYSWDFGDGSKGEGGPKASHVYRKGGTYTVKLTVNDCQDTACSEGMATTALRVNTPPVAQLGTATICCVDLPGTFDGSPSYDPDGDKLSYYWDFGDGGTATGVKANHTYTKPGVYKFTLKVDDNSGTLCSSSTACYTVDVHANPEAVVVIR